MDLSQIHDLIFARAAAFAGVDRATVTESTTLESLGLDSTDAVVLAMEVEEQSGVPVDVAIFLAHPDLGEAARAIEQLITEHVPASLPKDE